MATLLPSALSVAADGIVDFIDGHFRKNGEKVTVSVDNPVGAQEKAKASDAMNFINLFFYRVAPSGFHAQQTSQDPLFLRLYCLITPFPVKATDQAAPSHPDLRILGEVVRLFHETPVLDTLPADPGASATVYRLQATQLAPDMEEMNNIWTTQGSDSAYLLSVAYEFSLLPLDPVVHRSPGAPVRTALYQVDPSLTHAGDRPVAYGDDFVALPLADDSGAPPPTDWLPIIMLVQGDALTDTTALAASATDITVAVSGPAQAKAELSLSWREPDGSEADTSTQSLDVLTPHLDDPQSRVTVPLTRPANAASASAIVLSAKPLAAGGTALPGSPVSNRLTIRFAEGAP